MRRALTVPLLTALTLLPALAFAQDVQPSPERIKAAAEEFDRGRRSYLAKDFEGAAIHFENAYRDAPRAETLRLAIRARRDAKQLARAATLAAIAEQKYADDAQTRDLAKETLDSAAPLLHEYDVSCSSDCAIAADGHVVSQADSIRHRIFLEPGTHDLGASFGDGRSAGKKIAATKGGKDKLAFEAPPMPADKPAQPPPSPPPRDEHPKEETRSEKPFGPLLFFVGAGLTVVAGGLTVWSGIDTQNSPGTDAVRRDCAGKDESCPTYKEGKDKEVRTNILLGTTIGLGVITGVVGVFFTQWSHDKRVGVSSRGLTIRF